MSSDKRAVAETAPTAADVEWLRQNLDQVLHTHTSDLPYKIVTSPPVVEHRTLQGERDAEPYVASTTIEGPAFRAAIGGGAQTVAAAQRLADDGGDGLSFLDHVLQGSNDLDTRTGIPADVIQTLREKLLATEDKAPAQFTVDHPVLYFEADGQEVLVTPVMPVRVLRSINSRLAQRSIVEKNGNAWVGRPPVRLAMLIPQGGANPQTVAHYVNSSPKILPNGRIQTSGSRRGGYYALRALPPSGQRPVWRRDLSRVIASGRLATIGRVDVKAAKLYGSRSRTHILLPGLSARLATLRDAEDRHAQELAAAFSAPLFALREALREAKPKPDLTRVGANEARWLNNEASTSDATALAERVAAELCTRIARINGKGLPAGARAAIQKATERCLVRHNT
jgi:hypothetical protein